MTRIFPRIPFARLSGAVLDLAGKLWASPNTMIGLIAGGIGLAFGARLRFRHNAIVFLDYPFGPCGALTLGNVILATLPSLDMKVATYASRLTLHSANEFVHLGRHEEAHTYQYQALGPAFLLFYWLAGIGRSVSALEAAADRYAQTGTGWWPWWRRAR